MLLNAACQNIFWSFPIKPSWSLVLISSTKLVSHSLSAEQLQDVSQRVSCFSLGKRLFMFTVQDLKNKMNTFCFKGRFLRQRKLRMYVACCLLVQRFLSIKQTVTWVWTGSSPRPVSVAGAKGNRQDTYLSKPSPSGRNNRVTVLRYALIQTHKKAIVAVWLDGFSTHTHTFVIRWCSVQWRVPVSIRRSVLWKNEWRCLSDRVGGKRRKRGRRESLIAGCTVIQELRNVFEKHISDLWEKVTTVDKTWRGEAPKPTIQGKMLDMRVSLVKSFPAGFKLGDMWGC